MSTEQLSTARERDAVPEVAAPAELVDGPNHVARVAAALVVFALEAIQLFQDVDREDDVVFIEREECGGIVKEDVGIEEIASARKCADFEPVEGSFHGCHLREAFCRLRLQESP